MTIKCLVQRYDPEVTEPPLFITVGEFECGDGDNGDQRYYILRGECRKLGFTFKSYSNGDNPDYTYRVIVYGEGERPSAKTNARMNLLLAMKLERLLS